MRRSFFNVAKWIAPKKQDNDAMHRPLLTPGKWNKRGTQGTPREEEDGWTRCKEESEEDPAPGFQFQCGVLFDY